MKAKDLILLLQDMPPEAEVFVTEGVTLSAVRKVTRGWRYVEGSAGVQISTLDDLPEGKKTTDVVWVTSA